MAIVGYERIEEITAGQRLAAKLMTEDQRVARIARSENMLVEQRALLVVPRVVETRAVRRKCHAQITRCGQLIFQRFARGHIHHVQARIVRAAFLHGIEQQLAVARDIFNVHREVRVRAQLCRIHEPLIFPGPANAHIN